MVSELLSECKDMGFDSEAGDMAYCVLDSDFLASKNKQIALADKKASQIIKDSGYATSSNYVDKLCSIIERWNLTKYDVAVSTAPADGCPFLVRVSINDLNIRKGAGTNYARTGKYTGKGVFTIVEVMSGTGSAKGWGRLKSGAGWIALDYAVRI